MSRLYGKLISDRRKTPATAGANQELNTRLTWGSAKNPKLAISVEIRYMKDMERPIMFIDVGSDIVTQVQFPGEEPIQYIPE